MRTMGFWDRFMGGSSVLFLKEAVRVIIFFSSVGVSEPIFRHFYMNVTSLNYGGAGGVALDQWPGWVLIRAWKLFVQLFERCYNPYKISFRFPQKIWALPKLKCILQTIWIYEIQNVTIPLTMKELFTSQTFVIVFKYKGIYKGDEVI